MLNIKHMKGPLNASHETLILHRNLLGATIELMVDKFYCLWTPKSKSRCLTTISFSAPDIGFSNGTYIPVAEDRFLKLS